MNGFLLDIVIKWYFLTTQAIMASDDLGQGLDQLLLGAAENAPDATCLIEQGGQSVSYGELSVQAEMVANSLSKFGIGPGDRVGICAPKSIQTVAAVYGILRTGAAYVPVDPTAPAARSGGIFADCQVRAVLVAQELAGGIQAAMQDQHAVMESDAVIGLSCLTSTQDCVIGSTDTAYILYTSGSTGKPKGVTHTHASALAFVDWCSKEFSPTPLDRFSSHAPLHFDLSILDIYLPIKHGASIRLIDADEGKQPGTLAKLIETEKLTCWYSTPTILRAMVEYGDLATFDHSSLRIVCFAGEVFPAKHLKALAQHWPHPAYFNLFGPTETNVCTYFALGNPIDMDDADQVPIGFASSGDMLRITGADDEIVRPGEEGELLVSGGSVMSGYWNASHLDANVFIELDGINWYRTGDIVQERKDGALDYRGRRDRMVKRRGYRVELGEIEAAFLRHPDISQGAAVAVRDGSGDTQIVTFYCWTGETPASMIAMKRYASQNLPAYMTPDRFLAVEDLPYTSTDKINYQQLQETARGLFTD